MNRVFMTDQRTRQGQRDSVTRQAIADFIGIATVACSFYAIVCLLWVLID